MSAAHPRRQKRPPRQGLAVGLGGGVTAAGEHVGAGAAVQSGGVLRLKGPAVGVTLITPGCGPSVIRYWVSIDWGPAVCRPLPLVLRAGEERMVNRHR